MSNLLGLIFLLVQIAILIKHSVTKHTKASSATRSIKEGENSSRMICETFQGLLQYIFQVLSSTFTRN